MNTSSKWHRLSGSGPVLRAQWERRACGRQFDKTATSLSFICWRLKSIQDEETVQPHEAARQPDRWQVSVIYWFSECFYCGSCRNAHANVGSVTMCARTQDWIVIELKCTEQKQVPRCSKLLTTYAICSWHFVLLMKPLYIVKVCV